MSSRSRLALSHAAAHTAWRHGGQTVSLLGYDADAPSVGERMEQKEGELPSCAGIMEMEEGRRAGEGRSISGNLRRRRFPGGGKKKDGRGDRGATRRERRRRRNL